MRKFLLLLWFVSSCTFASQMITKVINLTYQQAQTIIQLVNPILQPGEQITGTGQTLIVKVSPETLTQLRVIIHKLDQPPITLQINIYQGDPNWLNNQSDVNMSISTQSRARQKRSQSVTVMNGESAFVSTGDNQPVVSNVGIGFFGAGVSYQRHLVQNGLLVEPTLQGQQVKLVIRRVRQQNSPASDQAFNEQQVNTTVLVPLNQWVPLASAEGAQPDINPNTRSIHAGPQFSHNSTLYIRVIVVGP